eukprot:5056276-Prorocentrum_lima.AAC.1
MTGSPVGVPYLHRFALLIPALAAADSSPLGALAAGAPLLATLGYTLAVGAPLLTLPLDGVR